MISPNKGYSHYICHETRASMYLITSLLRDFRNYGQKNEFRILLEFPNFSFNTYEESGPGLYPMSI